MVYVFTLVIVDPYADIDYDKINVYEIDEVTCEKDCIHVWSAEGLSDSAEEDNEEESKPALRTEKVFIPFNLDFLYK